MWVSSEYPNSPAPPSMPASAPGFVLGVDPDVERPGVALYDATAHRLAFCGTIPLRGLVDWLRRGADPAALPAAILPAEDFVPMVVLACVEDTRSRPLYARHRAAASSAAARDRMARSVGRLDEVTRLLLDEMAEAGIPARSCDPVRKVDADAFARITGYTGRTCQEARDAGALCFGVRVPPAERTDGRPSMSTERGGMPRRRPLF